MILVRQPISSDYILALVSGFPSRERGERWMLMLQGCFDDSGNSPNQPFFVLAGFISTVDEWIKFANAWDAKLGEQPSIQYFKMSEAMSKTGQFYNWPAELCEQKAFSLSEIIRGHAMVRVDCSVSRSIFDQLIKNVVGAPEYSDPYFMCFYRMVISIIFHQQTYGWNVPCDFIFDEHGYVGNNCIQWWHMMELLFSVRERPFIGNVPIFRNDKTFNPLQAADLYAWLVRDRLLLKSRTSVAPKAIIKILENMQTISRRFDHSDIKELSDRLVRLRLGLPQ